MNTYFKYTLSLLAISSLAFSSCSDDENVMEKPVSPDQAKTLVSFSGQDGQGSTRAYLADTRAGLDKDNPTKIVMHIKSVGAATTDIRYTRTVVQATKELAQNHDSNPVHSKLDDTHSDVSYPTTGDYFRYWDDAYGRDAKLSVYAVAVPGKDDAAVLSDDILVNNSTSKVSDTNPNWFTSDEKVGKCGWTLPTDQTGSSTSPNANYDLCYSNNISESGKKGVYKYKYSTSGWVIDNVVDGNMTWRVKESGSTAGKFDEGNLIFKHALCKVTINLNKGNGFNSTDAFSFKGGTNVELLDFPYKGTLDVIDGSWGSTENSTITKLEETTGTPATLTKRVVTGYTLPGKVLKGSNANALHFVIDNNDYYVTNDQIATAIQKYYGTGGAGASDPNASVLKGFTTMTQGHHYYINLTISKTKIENITAQLVGWEVVSSANIDPTNAYVNVTLETRENATGISKVTTDIFDLYRKASTGTLSESLTDYVTDYNNFVDYNWVTGYEASAATKTYKDGKWNTGWYWPDNLTYYHIRAIGAMSGDKPALVTNASGDNYVINAGDIEDASSGYKDYVWGAPFKKISDGTPNEVAEKFTYSLTNGFDGVGADADEEANKTHQIWKAIGAVNYVDNPVVNMMLFHMTSQIFFEVTTTTGSDKVALQTTKEVDGNTVVTNTKVELLRVYTSGTVLLGNGLVSVTGDKSEAVEMQMPATGGYTAESGSDPAVSKHQYGMVPQALSGTDYTVGVRITTPDGNQYVVNDISNVLSSAVTNYNIQNPYTANDGKYTINRWYPCYKYTYTVTIKKTGIVNITAQLVDWETVTGDLGEITLEDKD